MPRIRYTDEQIIAALKENEAGASVKDLCRRFQITEGTFSRWKAKHSGVDAARARRLRELEDENARLKSLLVDVMLDNARLKLPASKVM